MDAKTFRALLIRGYWEYQRIYYPNIEEHFDQPIASDKRPPVFHLLKATENVITKPESQVDEVGRLLNLMPVGERHKWFRSMAVHGALECLSDLQDDTGKSLTAHAELLPSNLAMEHKVDYLGESRRTSIDVYIAGNYRLAFECKFAEIEVGSCSRPKLTPADSNYERDYCDGTYSPQRTRVTPCSLTEVGVQYWQYVPQLFNWPDEMSQWACPLNKTYQLVRNILAVGVTPDGAVSLNSGHVVLIYDERNSAFQPGGKGLEAYSQTQQALLEPGLLRKCSWQRLIRHIRDRQLLPWLTERLAMKYGL
jgi:hypothetical protein